MSVLVAFINRFSYGYVLLWCLLHRLRSLFLLFRNRIYTLLYIAYKNEICVFHIIVVLLQRNNLIKTKK